MPISLEQLAQSAGVAVRQSREALQLAVEQRQNNEQLRAEVARLTRNAQELSATIQRTQVYGRTGDPHIQRVENIPGRRIPFDLLVDIPIRASDTGTVQGSITISQEGPFIAVARMATFLSAASFTVRSNGNTTARFQARSFGRYRPIHSAWDLNDGQPYSHLSMPLAFPGTGSPFIASPSNQSSFRSMQGDFRILFENAGSSFPRSNLEVPSTFWTKAINEPWELGALDFFERGEVLTFKVLPLHPQNPPFGNVTGFSVGNPLYPFLNSQYDVTEGISDPVQAEATSDPVTRVYDGIFTIGFHGYRIIQPAGAGPY